MPVAAPGVISTGKASEAELLVAGKLYVSNADADTLSIVDAASRAVKSMPATSGMILGATPERHRRRAGGRQRHGAHLRRQRRRERRGGARSRQRSPSSARSRPRGIRRRSPSPATAASSSPRRAASAAVPATARPSPTTPTAPLQLVPRPSDDELRAGSATVATNLDRPHSLEAPLTCTGGAEGAAQKFAVPAAAGAPAAIKHVFLVVRENKTYDGLFGDLPARQRQPRPRLSSARTSRPTRTSWRRASCSSTTSTRTPSCRCRATSGPPAASPTTTPRNRGRTRTTTGAPICSPRRGAPPAPCRTWRPRGRAASGTTSTSPACRTTTTARSRTPATR